MCCVIPPASPAATLALRMASRRGLAVIDVTHDGHDGGAWPQILRLVLGLVDDHLFLEGGRLNTPLKLRRHQLRGVEVDGAVDRDVADPKLPDLLENVGGLRAHLPRKLSDDDGFAHLDDALVLGGRRDLRLLRLTPGQGFCFAASGRARLRTEAAAARRRSPGGATTHGIVTAPGARTLCAGLGRCRWRWWTKGGGSITRPVGPEPSFCRRVCAVTKTRASAEDGAACEIGLAAGTLAAGAGSGSGIAAGACGATATTARWPEQRPAVWRQQPVAMQQQAESSRS